VRLLRDGAGCERYPRICVIAAEIKAWQTTTNAGMAIERFVLAKTCAKPLAMESTVFLY
jgi:hypothetical protein